MFGILIDKHTRFVIDKCVIVNDYEPKENEEIIPYEYNLGNPVVNMNKPKLDGNIWVDTEPLLRVETQEQELNKMETLEKENRQLWDTVELLLKDLGRIPKE